MEQLQELVRYRGKHGTTNVDQRNNKDLHNWTYNQNTSKHNGTMEPGRIDKLNQINFEWTV